ncbi:MAG: DUF2341 domain-containing protein [Euryarchaeota archaeon]|nr:DUF2341 domain-containing protein [Euryarchaeota archaeon]
MLEPCLFKRGTVLGIILLFIFGCCMPGLTGSSIMKRNQSNSFISGIGEAANKTIVTCVAFGRTRDIKQNIALTQDDATMIFGKLQELKSEMTEHPFSERTQVLKIAFVDLLDQKGLIPNRVSKETYLSLLNPRWVERVQKTGNRASFPKPFANSGTCTFCSVGGEGLGILIPLFLLPRPRITMLWVSSDSMTYAANLLTSKGYIASGAQTGFTFGFMGIGICYALPGYSLYGFIGYALLASTTAEYVEYYPPNRVPVISDVDPVDGEKNVPLSTSKLQFRIQDLDGDLMSYSVTTEPDIGSASGNLKPFGVYKVPISGLQDFTNYTWHVDVTDGKDTTEETLTFTTEAVAPIISNPSPADVERDVPIALSQLQFTLKDYQGDAMEYTVQTSPDIGSAHTTGVHDGIYTVPVSGLTTATMYRWFVNVTDGQHWTRKTFRFDTPYPDTFNPFDYGWHYRKKIIIDHTKVDGSQTNFPVLVSIIDSDLRQKAQQNGDDILFMNDNGVASRLNYEIESYDHSSGKLVAWVNIPVMSSFQDTMFYLYYGNPNCLSQQHPENTWDVTYKGVWHMNDATSTTIIDSTGSAHTGVKESVGHPIETSDGKIAQAQNFIQTDAITCSDSDDFSMTDGTSDVPFTLELWMYPTAINDHHVLVAKDGQINREWNFNYYGYQDYPRYTSIWILDNNDHYLYAQYFYDFQPNLWYHFAITYDGSGTLSGLTLYFNGVPVTWTETTNNGYTKMYNTNAPLFMGKYDRSDPKYYYGILDEVRISKGIVRSEGWIKTCYQNQNYPLDFIHVGPEEPHQ